MEFHFNNTLLLSKASFFRSDVQVFLFLKIAVEDSKCIKLNESRNVAVAVQIQIQTKYHNEEC